MCISFRKQLEVPAVALALLRVDVEKLKLIMAKFYATLIGSLYQSTNFEQADLNQNTYVLYTIIRETHYKAIHGMS